jgi:hypothetical protein
MGSSSTLSVRYTAKIVLAGPKDQEAYARRQLEQVLFEGYSEQYAGDESNPALSACYYLAESGRAAFYAHKIAMEVRYIARGDRIVIGLHSIDVLYRNGGDWRWWMRVRNGKGTRDPGEVA